MVDTEWTVRGAPTATGTLVEDLLPEMYVVRIEVLGPNELAQDFARGRGVLLVDASNQVAPLGGIVSLLTLALVHRADLSTRAALHTGVHVEL